MTSLGVLSFLLLITLACLPRLVVRLFSVHLAVSICLVFAGLSLALLALYGLANGWRMLRRGRRKVPFGEIDLGWGGAMGHYMDVEDDTSGKHHGY